MTPRCPDCGAFVRITYRGAVAGPNPWMDWEPVVKGVCHRHGEVEPTGWDWEGVFGDWDPNDDVADVVALVVADG